MNVFVEPTSGCPEGHTFCRQCYESVLASMQKKCPTCRWPTSTARLVRQRPLEDLVNRTLVRCKHAAVRDAGGSGNVDEGPASKRARLAESAERRQEGGDGGAAAADVEAGGVGGGCSWTGPLGDVEAHLGSSCGFEPVECTRSEDCECGCGCELLVARRDLERHVATECEHRPMPCPHCRGDICFGSLDDHAEDCEEKVEECVHEGCSAVTKIGDAHAHYDVCEFQTLACPCPGCETTALRRDMDAHMAAFGLKHVEKLIARDAEHARQMQELEARTRQEVGVAVFEWRVARGWGGARGSRVYSQDVRCGQFKICLGFFKLEEVAVGGAEQWAFAVVLLTPHIQLVAHAEILVRDHGGYGSLSCVSVPRLGGLVSGPNEPPRDLGAYYRSRQRCSSAPFSPDASQIRITTLEHGAIGVRAVVRLSIAKDFAMNELPPVSDRAGQGGM
ncbi:hypothetical protein T484DRAFT_2945917 [Baffinella frigidus]|nr:hypothetical protein T484DRAFT_2945917 [Cryptophyta sp. CCMP2293]